MRESIYQESSRTKNRYINLSDCFDLFIKIDNVNHCNLDGYGVCESLHFRNFDVNSRHINFTTYWIYKNVYLDQNTFYKIKILWSHNFKSYVIVYKHSLNTYN